MLRAYLTLLEVLSAAEPRNKRWAGNGKANKGSGEEDERCELHLGELEVRLIGATLIKKLAARPVRK